MLFGADAHAPLLLKNLQRYAAEIGEARPRIDLFKLSHHGSNANISMDLLRAIDCRRFLISTNGDNFAHPDDAAIAKVISAADKPVTFYCNYHSARTDPWGQHGPAVGATFEFPKPPKTSLRVPSRPDRHPPGTPMARWLPRLVDARVALSRFGCRAVGAL